jgi:hypothetical protein
MQIGATNSSLSSTQARSFRRSTWFAQLQSELNPMGSRLSASTNQFDAAPEPETANEIVASTNSIILSAQSVGRPVECDMWPTKAAPAG